jgi:hypothetical protein
MEIRSKTIEAPRARVARAQRSIFAHRISGYIAIVTILLFAAFIAGIAIGSSPVPAAIVLRVLASHALPYGFDDDRRISTASGPIA